MSAQEKRKECYDRFSDFVSYSIMAGVCIGMPLSHYDEASKCPTPIITWLCVQGGIYLSSVLKNLAAIAVIYMSSCPKKHKATIDLLYLCVVLNFQFAWLIYGNTFHYSDVNVQCRAMNDTLNSLWILEMIILAVGYIYFAVYGCAFCVLSCVCCLMVNAANQAQMQEMVQRIPYGQAVAGLKRTEFKNVQEKNKNMKDCVICMQDFKEDDQIAELKCDERHYFHSACLEDWLKQKLECPLCKKPVSA